MIPEMARLFSLALALAAVAALFGAVHQKLPDWLEPQLRPLLHREAETRAHEAASRLERHVERSIAELRRLAVRSAARLESGVDPADVVAEAMALAVPPAEVTALDPSGAVLAGDALEPGLEPATRSGLVGRRPGVEAHPERGLTVAWPAANGAVVVRREIRAPVGADEETVEVSWRRDGEVLLAAGALPRGGGDRVEIQRPGPLDGTQLMARAAVPPTGLTAWLQSGVVLLGAAVAALIFFATLLVPSPPRPAAPRPEAQAPAPEPAGPPRRTEAEPAAEAPVEPQAGPQPEPDAMPEPAGDAAPGLVEGSSEVGALAGAEGAGAPTTPAREGGHEEAPEPEAAPDAREPEAGGAHPAPSDAPDPGEARTPDLEAATPDLREPPPESSEPPLAAAEPAEPASTRPRTSMDPAFASSDLELPSPAASPRRPSVEAARSLGPTGPRSQPRMVLSDVSDEPEPSSPSGWEPAFSMATTDAPPSPASGLAVPLDLRGAPGPHEPGEETMPTPVPAVGTADPGASPPGEDDDWSPVSVPPDVPTDPSASPPSAPPEAASEAPDSARGVGTGNVGFASPSELQAAVREAGRVAQEARSAAPTERIVLPNREPTPEPGSEAGAAAAPPPREPPAPEATESVPPEPPSPPPPREPPAPEATESVPPEPPSPPPRAVEPSAVGESPTFDVAVPPREPYDAEHYRAVHATFSAARERTGAGGKAVDVEAFCRRLRVSEEGLRAKHACRLVRFQVLIRDDKVTLRPQLIR
jgi:hypothetical protein